MVGPDSLFAAAHNLSERPGGTLSLLFLSEEAGCIRNNLPLATVCSVQAQLIS